MTAAHARLATSAFVDRNRGRVIGIVAGRPVLAIAGAEDPPPDPANPPAADKTFTQAEVNAIASREKAQGKTAAAADIAKELGVSVEDAKALIKRAQDADRAAETAAEKSKREAEEIKAQATADRTAAAQEKRDAAIERVLIRAGVTDEKLTRAQRTLELPEGADADAIKAAVEALVKEEPTWFGKTAGTTTTAPSSHTGGRPPAAQGSKKPGEEGEAEALRRFPQLAKTS